MRYGWHGICRDASGRARPGASRRAATTLVWRRSCRQRAHWAGSSLRVQRPERLGLFSAPNDRTPHGHGERAGAKRPGRLPGATYASSAAGARTVSAGAAASARAAKRPVDGPDAADAADATAQAAAAADAANAADAALASASRTVRIRHACGHAGAAAGSAGTPALLPAAPVSTCRGGLLGPGRVQHLLVRAQSGDANTGAPDAQPPRRRTRRAPPRSLRGGGAQH
mmetsp:Transcript_18374/g.53641  ORF Transcript_18374/g.53641 Transcript_18374/m.53641 type:complete len:227 (+) Transcript_18374:236-916(+)